MTSPSPPLYNSFSGCRMAYPISGVVWIPPYKRALELEPLIRKRMSFRVCKVRASAVEGGSSNFAKRIEQAWLISQQPRPIECSTCESKGNNECKWCGGTGFFILGDNMLCQVPSKNTTCVICAGKGSMQCSDCQGTGFRAKWLLEPPTSNCFINCDPLHAIHNCCLV